MKKAITLISIVTLGVAVQVANADFTFGEPTNLGPEINGPGEEVGACLSPDGLSLYFQRMVNNIGKIWVTRRTTPDSEWGPPSNLLSGAGPCLSADGLQLYFMEYLPGGSDVDLWVSTRQTSERMPEDYWDIPVNLGATVNSSSGDYTPSLSTDGLELYFSSDRSGGFGSWDLWVTTRPTVDDNWDTPINLGPTLNTSGEDNWPGISPDGLLLFFGSNRSGGSGSWDLYMARRATTKDPWGPPMNLGPMVNSTTWETGTKVSPDGSTLYFNSPRPGGFGASDIWQAPIIPIVDLNTDGIVDAADMSIMIDHWGEDYSLCDIGPMPWGDGIVDVRDLIVLAEHMYGYIQPVAHWTLNETEGDTAYDKYGKNDALVYGSALWQPGWGKVGGSLMFDGTDDYVGTPFVLNPGKTSFSVTAWIKGGATGQVIISQADVEGQSALESGGTWLGISQSDGRLMTGLMDIFFGPLESESVVADGQWHHVGLVYDFDTMKRHLYVDGAQVAIDAGLVAGVQSTARLYIGAGQTLEAPTFFSGLIDDVRIYDRALTPEQIAALAQ
jgi:hypothetical protein